MVAQPLKPGCDPFARGVGQRMAVVDEARNRERQRRPVEIFHLDLAGECRNPSSRSSGAFAASRSAIRAWTRSAKPG
ncbi:MAG: hypothetical protein ACRDS0_02810 [Pseudonocardiaceae bacterium]